MQAVRPYFWSISRKRFTLLSLIGKRFQNAGLRDLGLCIESGVIEEGSALAVFEGRNYNRAIRFHKLAYEAFMRVTWEGFEPWLEASHSDEPDEMTVSLNAVGYLVDDLNKGNHDDVLQLQAFQSLCDRFAGYLDHLKNTNGPMSSFWFSYINMVELLLQMVRASKEGDWMLNLFSVQKMLPWCLVYVDQYITMS